MNISMIITGNALREWRCNLGWTQRTLAIALGVDQMTVSRWERGVRPLPRMVTLAMRAIEQMVSNRKDEEAPMLVYRVKVIDPESGATIMEPQFRNLRDAEALAQKYEKTIIIYHRL